MLTDRMQFTHTTIDQGLSIDVQAHKMLLSIASVPSLSNHQ